MQFRSIVSLACAVSLFTGSALASAVYARRVDELTMERDIYASREENWMNKAVERKETIEQLQTEVEQLTDTIAADQSIALTYAGEFHCTAYCSEEYPHICGEGQGITSSGAKVQPGVTVAADTSIFPYGTVILIEGVGIRAALLQNVDGIMEAKVFENDTDDVDDYGLPPHSIEAVVYGGLDSDIAQIIYKELGAGIQTTGQKVVEVITASGATKAIHFNRPHPVPVYVKVVGLSTSGDFPHDGVDQLRAAIVAYIGDNESGGVSIGETLYHQRLPAVLYKVPGVLDFDVLIGTDAENLQADNIPVDSRSKVVTDDGMVTIDA